MTKAVTKKAAAVKKPAVRGGLAKPAAASKSTLASKPGAATVAKKRPAAHAPAVATAVDAQTLAHGLNALLHTMQTVQQSEERICSLMHALRRGRASRPLLTELREVLAQLPAHDYLHEVEALRDSVAT